MLLWRGAVFRWISCGPKSEHPSRSVRAGPARAPGSCRRALLCPPAPGAPARRPARLPARSRPAGPRPRPTLAAARRDAGVGSQDAQPPDRPAPAPQRAPAPESAFCPRPRAPARFARPLPARVVRRPCGPPPARRRRRAHTPCRGHPSAAWRARRVPVCCICCAGVASAVPGCWGSAMMPGVSSWAVCVRSVLLSVAVRARVLRKLWLAPASDLQPVCAGLAVPGFHDAFAGWVCSINLRLCMRVCFVWVCFASVFCGRPLPLACLLYLTLGSDIALVDLLS